MRVFFAKISPRQKSAKLFSIFNLFAELLWHKIGEFHHRKFKNKPTYVKNFKPLADRVLVEPVQAETKTVSGIIIPDTAKENHKEGTEVAVGNGNQTNQ